MNILRSASLLALAAAALSASAQNLVTNGGFETGDFTGWTASNNYFSVASSRSHSGTYNATANLPSALSQTLATNAGTYTIGFWLRSLAPGPSVFTVSFGGTRLLTLTNPDEFDYTFYRFTTDATSTSTNLKFELVSGNGRIFRIDDVSVVASAPAVPGPLAALPFALIVLNRRRKRA